MPVDPLSDLLRLRSPREILRRLADGDPLEIEARVVEVLRESGWLVDPRRLTLRAMACTAYAAPDYRGKPELSRWLRNRIEDALQQMLEEEVELTQSAFEGRLLKEHARVGVAEEPDPETVLEFRACLAVRGVGELPAVGAWATCTMDPDSRTARRVSSGSTDEHGLVTLAVPRSRPFRVQAGQHGYSGAESQTLFWSPNLERIELALAPACKLRGRVVSAGNPVGKFNLAVWTRDVYRSKVLHFEDPEGRFEIADLGPGRLCCFAEPAHHPQSRTYEVELRPYGSEELSIELPESSTARGHVVDAATLRPIPTARVTRYSTRGNLMLHPCGDSLPVDSEGHFALGGVGGEGTGYAVEATGYSPCYGLLGSTPGSAEIGLVPLQATSRLIVRILLSPGADPTHESVFSDTSFAIPSTTFPASGELVFADLPAISGYLTLLRADGVSLRREVSLQPGSTTRLVFDLRASRDLRLLFGRDTAEGEARGGELRIQLRDANGRIEVRTERLARRGELVAHGLPCGRAALELRSRGGSWLGSADVDLGEANCAAIHVQTRARSARVRVLDHEHKPIAAARVELCEAEGLAPWNARGESDAEGLVELGSAPCALALASVFTSGRGRAHGLLVDLEAACGAPVELVVDARQQIRIQCFESGLPRPGVRFSLRPDAVSAWSSVFLTCREDGLGESGPLSEGDYPLEVSSGGLWPTRHLVHVPQKQAPERIELVARTDLELLALDEYEKPCAAATLELSGVEISGTAAEWLEAMRIESSSLALRTDAQGRLVLRGLPAVTVRWHLRGVGVSSAEGELRLAPSTTNQVRARLR